MDFQLNEEQKMIKQLAHELAEKVFRPLVSEWDSKKQFMPNKYLRKLAEHGLLGMSLPVEYGGQGRSAFDSVLAIEELSRIGLAASSPVFKSNLGPIRVIEQYGTEKQKRKYLPRVCCGDFSVTQAMTEPEAGSALTDLETKAVLKKDVYIVNGIKRFISFAGEADGYITYVRFNEKKGANGIGALIIEKDTPGLSFDKKEQFMGFRSITTGDLVFEDCEVPVENLIVDKGGFKNLMNTWDLSRCGNAATALGMAQGALEQAVSYSQERKQFGKYICEFQSIQKILAEMTLKVEATRLLVYRAASNAGYGLASPMESSLAKCFANETVREVAGMAIDIHGGYGYSKDYPVERLFRDGWGLGIAGGTNEMLKITIASQLLGRKFSQRK